MAQKIKITKIDMQESATDGRSWQKYTITGEDGAKASTFDTTASSLKEGDIIEAEIELKGKYANIKSYKLVEYGVPILKLAPPPTPSKSDWSEKDRITRKSIERQKSLELAVEVVKLNYARLVGDYQIEMAEEVIIADTIATAKMFEAYLEGKVEPKPLSDTPGAIKKPVDSLTSDQVSKAEKAPVIEDLSWPVVWGKAEKLFKERKPGFDSLRAIIKTMTDIGATDSSSVMTAFESLSEAGKRKLVELVKEVK